MSIKGDKKLTPLSQSLRKQMTEEERKLWYTFLKTLPITIRRQKVVGRYILDFYYAEKKIAIEIDGEQYFLNEGKQKDIERDQYLSEQGISVLRYSNYDLNKNFKAVCEDIYNKFGLK